MRIKWEITDLTSLHEGVEERCIDEEEQVGAEL